MKPAGSLLILGAAVLLVAAAVLLRSKPAAPAPEPPSPARLARVRDEGSALRESPEEVFIEQASKMTPKEVRPLDLADPLGESRRVLSELAELFGRMKQLAALYKKSDPARYAAEMSALKEELAARLHSARTALQQWDPAQEELFRMLRESGDPEVQKSLAFLLRYTKPDRASPVLVVMAESPKAGDREVAIRGLGDVRTQESARVLIRHAAADADLELRQRSILELRRILAGSSAETKAYRDEAWAAFRGYAAPAHPIPVREAVFKALADQPSLLPEDKDLIRDTLRTETDPVVRKAAEDAQRNLNARQRAKSDQVNPAR